MGALYGHVWGIEIGPESGAAQLWTDYRTRFDVRQAGSTATASVEVVNPPDELVGALRQDGALVRVLAGWEDGGRQEVARGYVVPRSIDWNRQPPTHRVAWEMSAGRGPLVLTALALALPGKVTTLSAFEQVRQALGIQADDITVGSDVTSARGRTLTGSASVVLDDLAEESGSRWAIVDGRLRVWPEGGQVRRYADVWDESTGLLSVTAPASSGKDVRVSAHLRPGLRPGDAIRVESDTWSGQLIAREVQHAGDSHGNDWRTSVVGRPG